MNTSKTSSSDSSANSSTYSDPEKAIPKFAVVGHPNKGKSSIVSTLTRQDAVSISEISGTTTHAQPFTCSVDGQSLYDLIDTPGFQRPRQLLEWLEAHVTNASQRVEAVQDFLIENRIETSSGETTSVSKKPSRYRDEVELLTPIMAGAGILYVVDGSLPYSPEFEAEMSILQWTGQPRMALINPIGGEAYVEQWRSALSQFFSIVRVFDPMTANEQKKLAVLSAFAELYEPWRPAIERALSLLKDHQAKVDMQSAYLVAECLSNILSETQQIKVPVQFAESALKAQLAKQYQTVLRNHESHCWQQLQSLYALTRLQTQSSQLQTDFPDLFDQSTWYIFGLDRKKLIALSAAAGAASGAVIDVGVGGASLMAGALAGGLVTGLASLAATWKTDVLNIKGIPVAGKMLTAGPVKEAAFAFVVLGRQLDFLEVLCDKNHADRMALNVQERSMTHRLERLSKTEQIRLTRLLQKAHKGLSQSDMGKLAEVIGLLRTNQRSTL
jgi:hypothetical protein